LTSNNLHLENTGEDRADRDDADDDDEDDAWIFRFLRVFFFPAETEELRVVRIETS
jgi:hypothetical protein